ncbi:MAG: allantoicase [Pyrinomonadaceae bacterium]|nr:allantoicase [Pyrinomonadaceae bacterium]
MTLIETQAAAFTGLVDLASERVGGKTVIASDEFFAPKENLLKAGRGIFIPDKYTENGKWMDGWESRRKRVAGYDWCVLKLGLSGIIKGVDIDTNHFLGNHPPYASLDACCVDNNDVPAETLASSETKWVEILGRSSLNPGSQNLFSISDSRRWTHLRLNIYPDGGVARLKVYGDVVPRWEQFAEDEFIDLAAVENGGLVTACSDMFFGKKENLIMPGRALNMGDGWETKRRRGPGFDWAVIQLGHLGTIAKIEVDTNHFKGNYPDRCSIQGCRLPGKMIDALSVHEIEWHEVLPETKLEANTRHYFEHELKIDMPLSHVRLNIFPDGGVSRLRAFGLRSSPTEIKN